MKKLILLICLTGLYAVTKAQGVKPQKMLVELTGKHRYAEQNAKLPAPETGEPRVVFIGNSITQGWARDHASFFTSNGYVGRGIGGQGTVQMLMRFQADVVALKPQVVVINCGTNDIAENVGPYDPAFTMESLRSMVQIAQANGITPILSSVLPSGGFRWNPAIEDVPRKIIELNKLIKAYADSQSLEYIDYHAVLRNSKDALDSDLADDGVHPTPKTYTIMEKVAVVVIDSVLSEKSIR